MTRGYNSFLLRCWWAGERGERIAIEHIQSGETALSTSVEAALAWVAARAGDPSHGGDDGREGSSAMSAKARPQPACGRPG